MNIRALPSKAKHLRPGDLFSTADQSYWDGHAERKSIGERVYIRTEEPCPDDQAEERVYLILVRP